MPDLSTALCPPPGVPEPSCEAPPEPPSAPPQLPMLSVSAATALQDTIIKNGTNNALLNF